MNVKIDNKNITQTPTHILKKCSNVFQIHNSLPESVEILLKHAFEGSLISNSLEAAEAVV